MHRPRHAPAPRRAIVAPARDIRAARRGRGTTRAAPSSATAATPPAPISYGCGITVTPLDIPFVFTDVILYFGFCLTMPGVVSVYVPTPRCTMVSG